LHELSDFSLRNDSTGLYVAETSIDGGKSLGVFLAAKRGLCHLWFLRVRHFSILISNFAERNRHMMSESISLGRCPGAHRL
jgi:hypothetical protein